MQINSFLAPLLQISLLFCIVCAINSVSLTAQNALLKKANKLYDQGAYPRAAQLYKQVLQKNKTPEAVIKIANCYRLTKKFAEAEYWYAEAVKQANVDVTHIYHYGMMLKANGKYKEALIVFKEYNQKMPTDTRGEWQMTACSKADYFLKDPGIYKVSPINQNTRLADFGTSFYKEGVVYASEANVPTNGEVYDRRNAPFLALFYSKQINDDPALLGTPQSLMGDANSNLHEGVVTFSSDFQTMFFTGNTTYKSKKKKRMKIVRLHIYEVQKKENVNEWGEKKHFPYNNPNHSVGHPSLSYDGKTMYFVSDMPGGYGGTDIYVTYKTNGKWDYPINLGPKINTEGNEMFPFISETNRLYFSSDALPGLGGLDVFSSTQLDDDNWDTAVNLRYPINSNGDDFGFIIDESNDKGYFSSNREGGKGDDDIYAFQRKINETKPVKTAVKCVVEGIVSDKATGKPLSGVTVKLMNTNTNTQFITSANGRYRFTIDNNNDYTLFATKSYYFTEVNHISTRGRDCSSPILQNMELDIRMSRVPGVSDDGIFDQPIKIVDRGNNSHPDLPLPELNPIYYDLDQSYIRPDAQVELDKVVAFMKSNPKLIIELGSHTDSRGSSEYNQNLSNERAQAAIRYIIGQGVNPNNIKGKGFGETQILNRCTDGVTCSEDEHQFNRRTEFIIIGYRD